LARLIGVVPQGEEAVFPPTVGELVAMGRYPQLGGWRREREADRREVEEAMRRSDVLDLADRPLATLSGGERRRARRPRAPAQQHEVLAVDERSASFDVRREMAVFQLPAAPAAEDGLTVVLVTHALILAARYADRLLLLANGRAAADGPPGRVLNWT